MFYFSLKSLSKFHAGNARIIHLNEIIYYNRLPRGVFSKVKWLVLVNKQLLAFSFSEKFPSNFNQIIVIPLLSSICVPFLSPKEMEHPRIRGRTAPPLIFSIWKRKQNRNQFTPVGAHATTPECIWHTAVQSVTSNCTEVTDPFRLENTSKIIQFRH